MFLLLPLVERLTELSRFSVKNVFLVGSCPTIEWNRLFNVTGTFDDMMFGDASYEPYLSHDEAF